MYFAVTKKYFLPAALAALTTLTTGLLVFSCSDSNLSRSKRSSGSTTEIIQPVNEFDPANVNVKELDVTIIGAEFPPDSQVVDQPEISFAAATLLDGRAVGSRYRRVFKDFRKNTPDFFLIPEQINLGTVNRTGPLGAWNNRWLSAPAQDYIRTLRIVLNQSCGGLVTAEANILKTDPAVASGKNLLIKNLLSPTKEDVSQFMTKMFGYDRIGGLHDGAEDYQKVFAENVAGFSGTDAEKASFAAENYRLLCIAIGQDLRVFLR